MFGTEAHPRVTVTSRRRSNGAARSNGTHTWPILRGRRVAEQIVGGVGFVVVVVGLLFEARQRDLPEADPRGEIVAIPAWRAIAWTRRGGRTRA